MSPEARISLHAFAVFLVVMGVLWLGVQTEVIHASSTEDAEKAKDIPYLLGVWGRSLKDAFQFLLLVGVVTVPIHAIWVFGRSHSSDVLQAYNSFGAWAQTLFTSLGFLGTIIGVSLAVAGLRAAMTANDPGQLIVGLATAFDTTFLGLVGALLLMVIRKVSVLVLSK